jgi:hypothetical protein
VQLATHIADQRYQARLDKRVDVFREGFCPDACGSNRFQAGADLIGFVRGQNTRTLQRRTPSDARPHVDGKQSPVEAKRTIELRELRIRLTLKPTAPQLFLTHNLTLTNLPW